MSTSARIAIISLSYYDSFECPASYILKFVMMIQMRCYRCISHYTDALLHLNSTMLQRCTAAAIASQSTRNIRVCCCRCISTSSQYIKDALLTCDPSTNIQLQHYCQCITTETPVDCEDAMLLIHPIHQIKTPNMIHVLLLLLLPPETVNNLMQLSFSFPFHFEASCTNQLLILLIQHKHK